MDRVVPTSRLPAPPQPQQWAPGTPPSLRLPQPLCAFPALPTACHAPMQAPDLAAELRAGEAWRPSQAVKVGKLETEINPQSCSAVKVTAGRPSTQSPGPWPPSSHGHPISHPYTLGLYKRGDPEAEPWRQLGRPALPLLQAGLGLSVAPPLPGSDPATPELPLSAPSP